MGASYLNEATEGKGKLLVSKAELAVLQCISGQMKYFVDYQLDAHKGKLTAVARVENFAPTHG